MYGDSRGGGFRPRRSFAPVKVGDELDIKVEAVGEKGDGIAKKDGFVLFIPNTNEGDEVKIKVTKVLNRVGFAEVVGSSSGSTETAEEAPSDSEDFGEEESTDEPAEESASDSAEESSGDEAPASEGSFE